jgi:NAD(P)-dependent dehydrogenase (short-subunit alcohol dehydrogenase family)
MADAELPTSDAWGALAGTRVVVIGGSSGIGEAVALAARAAGADVTVGSRRGEADDGLRAIAVDVTDDASVERAFSTLEPFDHLVCTAASGFPGALLRSPAQDVRGLMESKFWGQYRCVRAAAPLLREGASITLTSGIRSRRPIRGSGAFTTVNMAVEGLVRALAIEMAPVRVNGLAPGTIDTPVFDALPPDARAQRLEAMAAQTTVGRVGTADEAAQVVLLCMANAFLSGAVIDVDGGGLLA